MLQKHKQWLKEADLHSRSRWGHPHRRELSAESGSDSDHSKDRIWQLAWSELLQQLGRVRSLDTLGTKTTWACLKQKLKLKQDQEKRKYCTFEGRKIVMLELVDDRVSREQQRLPLTVPLFQNTFLVEAGLYSILRQIHEQLKIIIATCKHHNSLFFSFI